MPKHRLLLILIGLLIVPAVASLPARADLPLSLGGQGGDVPTLAPLLDKITPGVVNISVRGHVAAQTNPLLQDPFFRRFFGVPGTPGAPAQREFRAAGSGVIVDAEKGYVITNNHVVENAEQITVTLRDGRRLKAERVGVDPEADVAVIQIPAENLTAVPLGDSDALRVGDFVIAIGNPFGIGQTVTSGMVSALGRSGLGIEGYEDFIQTDASINPGNSGGALVSLRGELVGINTAIIGPGGGNVGIGFAIPINMAKGIMGQLVAHGEVRRGQLGILIQNLTPDIADALGIDARQGAVVAKVVAGSAADKAGLKAGDVIVDIDGNPVRNASDLRTRVGLAQVGASVRLGIVRNGEAMTVDVTLAPRAQAKVEAASVDPRLAGAVFGAIEPGSPAYGKMKGVAIVEVAPGSPAWNGGLRKGDIIVAVNRQPVASPDDIQAAAAASKRVMLLNILRGNTALFLAIR